MERNPVNTWLITGRMPLMLFLIGAVYVVVLVGLSKYQKKEALTFRGDEMYIPATSVMAGMNKHYKKEPAIIRNNEMYIPATSSPHEYDENSPISKCTKRHNVFYAKIYKCASTTITSIMMRFANANNLSVAFPNERQRRFTKKTVLESMDKVTRTRDDKYNMFCFHWNFNKQVIEQIMHPNTIYLASLRKPVARYVSHYNFGRTKADRYKMSVEQHLQEALKNGGRLADTYKNTMIKCLGFTGSVEQLPKYLEQLDSWFHLVLIVEYLDESLILMKHQLCWDMDDMVYLSINVNLKKVNDKRLSNESYALVKKYLNLDDILYQYFLEKFLQKLDAFGKERMKEEVAELRSRRLYWSNYCVQKHENGTNVYSLTNEGRSHPVCQQLSFTESRVLTREKQIMMVKEGYKFPSLDWN